MRISLLVCVLMVAGPAVAAAETNAACEAQLVVERAHDHLVQTHRNTLERQLATLAGKAEELGKRVEQLMRENAALKAQAAPPPAAPQPD